jgi:hypothetical protein
MSTKAIDKSTVQALRDVYADLTHAERVRLHEEALRGDPLAVLVVGAL